MARPQKRGLDYFNLDCIQDDNLTFIEAKHGVEGFGIVVKLWQKIYRHDGYFISWNEQSMYLFAREIGVHIDVISSVVNTCLLPNISIFNQELLDKYGVLTSKGIQKRWQTVVKLSKRKNTDIDEKYNLIELTPEETKLTPVETKETPSESTQSKVKESKVNKIKENKEGEKVSPPTLNDRKISFKNSLDPFLELYGKEMLNKFYRHWTEMNEGGKKMRFEMQTVFEISKRLVTWRDNDIKFNKNGNNQKLKPGGFEPRKEITSYGKL